MNKLTACTSRTFDFFGNGSYLSVCLRYDLEVADKSSMSSLGSSDTLQSNSADRRIRRRVLPGCPPRRSKRGNDHHHMTGHDNGELRWNQKENMAPRTASAHVHRFTKNVYSGVDYLVPAESGGSVLAALNLQNSGVNEDTAAGDLVSKHSFPPELN